MKRNLISIGLLFMFLFAVGCASTMAQKLTNEPGTTNAQESEPDSASGTFGESKR